MKKIVKIVGITIGVVIICILVTGIVLMRYGFKPYTLTSYNLPEQSSTSWDEVFKHPVSITVIPFQTGVQNIDRYPQNPPDAEDRYGPTDILAFGVQHAILGDMLIDTGFDHSFSENPPFGNYPFMARQYLKSLKYDDISQPKGQDIASLLTQCDLQPQKVFFTHLHIDHTAGIPALPKGIEYVLDPRELNFLVKALIGGHFAGVTELHTVDFSQAKEMPPLGPTLDLLGDGSLWAISTPGHSEGHISYLVNGMDGPTLITGDAAFYDWGFANGIGSTVFDMDAEGAQHSREQLLAFILQYPQVTVFVGHERPADAR